MQERLGHLRGAEEAMAAIGYLPQAEYLRLDETRLHSPENEELLKAVDALSQAKLNELKAAWAALPARTLPTHAYRSVQAVGCHSAIGKRHNMEDDEIMVDSYCGVENQGYFGLYDGHGGRATVDFVVKALHINLEQYLSTHPACDMSAAFKHSYMTTDGQLRRQSILRSGSTSVTCVVRTLDGQRVLHTANVGDSRAVLSRAGKAVRLTIDHKASLPEEAKRIREAGGFIGRNKRVNGVLAISRALGDHMVGLP
jgi:serine/threonine protein phosphatase PrpC